MKYLPAGAEDVLLLVTDRLPEAALLIGHESSPFHRKAYFSLEPVTSSR